MTHRVRSLGYPIILLAALLLLPTAEASQNWPSFRGQNASGVGDGPGPPATFNGETGVNIKWRTAIPGLGHSSPVVWGDKVFITSAVSSNPEPELTVGNYGSIDALTEDFVHHYRVYCVDKNSGQILWEKTAHSGKPQVKRHAKSSHASSTAATDGKHVVAHFGSEGLYCYDMAGKLEWKVDLGYLDSTFFLVPEAQWGYGSSPIIYKDRVIVLCDVHNQSFIAAFAIADGKQLWRTLRDEVPTWGTPTVNEAAGRTQVIVNGWKHIGGYDVSTGEELWRMGGGGDIPVPTPICAHGMIFITGSHGPARPLFAIRANAEGDISLAAGETANQHVVWSLPRRGVYMQTPIVVGDYLYAASNRGVLTCYQAKTGKQVYRERVAGKRGAFSGSPVAAGGNLFFSDEFGEIHVIKAGPEYQHIASNPMGELLMATPAISGNMLLVRGNRHLYGIAKTKTPLAIEARPAAAQEEAAKPVSPATTGGDQSDGLTDPVAILRRADAAAKAVNTVRYHVEVVGTEAAKAVIPSISLTITATGFLDQFPEKFIVEGEVVPPGATAAIPVSGGSDGDLFYAIDHGAKTVHADFEYGVMGVTGEAFYRGVVGEFYYPEPFSDEIKAAQHELLEDRKLDGEDCTEVRVVYSTEAPAESIWCFAKGDFLARRVHRVFEIRGEKGGMVSTISDLVVDPKLDPGAFEVKVPEGYTRTDEPLN